MTILLTVIVLMIVGVLLIRNQIRSNQLAEDKELLRAVLFDLIRLLETTPTNSSSRRGQGRIEILREFGIGTSQRSLTSQRVDLADSGFQLIDRNEADGSGHWAKVNNIRQGCFAFYCLVRERSPSRAYTALAQTRGFVEFRQLMRSDIPLSAAHVERLTRLINSDLTFLYADLFYKPWLDGDPVFTGPEILDQMREYMR